MKAPLSLPLLRETQTLGRTRERGGVERDVERTEGGGGAYLVPKNTIEAACAYLLDIADVGSSQLVIVLVVGDERDRLEELLDVWMLPVPLMRVERPVHCRQDENAKLSLPPRISS